MASTSSKHNLENDLLHIVNQYTTSTGEFAGDPQYDSPMRVSVNRIADILDGFLDNQDKALILPILKTILPIL